MLIRTIFRKELLEVLRDRRTLIAMVLVPVVLYPVVIIGVLQLAHGQEQDRWAETLEVAVRNEPSRSDLHEVQTAVEEDQARRIARLRAQGVEVRDDEHGGIEVVIEPDLYNAVRRKTFPVGVDVILRPPPSGVGSPERTFKVVINNASDRSRDAGARVQQMLIQFREITLRNLVARQDAHSIPTFEIASENIAPPDAQLRWLLAKIMPIILILMTITGAVYPAIDLTAGERERGTLETLMVCPVPVISLIVGKFFVVMVIAVLSATLNLASIGATVYFIGVPALLENAADPGSFEVAPTEMSDESTDAESVGGGVSLLSMLRICATILLVMIPFAVFASAMLIAVSSFARTFKEAQNYVAPVILVCLIPCFVAALPDTQLSGLMRVLPVANMVLLTRELLLDHVDAAAMMWVLLSTMVYGAAAVALAARLFGQEAVVFSDNVSWRGLLDRRRMRPTRWPSPAQALILTSLLFPANFYIQSSFQGLAESDPARHMVYVGLTILVLMGLVPLCVSAYFKIELKHAFRLDFPRPRYWLAGGLLGLAGWVLSHEILILQSAVLETPEALKAQSEALTRTLSEMNPVLVFLVFAVIPGVCEELFFRGFLLSGLAAEVRRGLSIVAAAAVFAVFHVLISRFAVTFVLGLMLGLLCWQSRSVLPGLLAHVLYNASVLAIQLFPPLARALRLDQLAPDAHLPIPHLVVGAAALLLAIALMRGRPEPVPAAPIAIDESVVETAELPD